MTVFEKIKSMDIDEFTEWFKDNCIHDDDPSIDWWNYAYCSQCEPEYIYSEYFNTDIEYCWCEQNGKCKYFTELEDMPSCEQRIKMWLESEYGM